MNSSHNNTGALNKKIWSIAGVLRDDGISDSDYLEQLTYMLFLKMVDEYNKPPHNRGIELPDGVSWEELASKKGADLETYYVQLLETLSGSAGVLGQIYTKAVNKITTPVKLKQVISIVDGENWTSMSSDVKGDVYEGLLKKVSEDTKSGAGQYFTPRAIINTMVKCMRPEPGKTIVDPACGSGGFLLSAKDYILENNQLNEEQQKKLKFDTFFGWEIDIKVYRQCLMNLFLHNIGDLDGTHTPGITRNDALLQEPSQFFDYCLANPPFGTKSSTKISTDDDTSNDETYNRQDFWVTGKNKQLNFVQHINSILKVDGKAAIVVPDNVLFEGGAGKVVRKKLLETCDLHTILRLSKGMFYAQGVQANVIFFDKKPAGGSHKTKDVWVYDFRTDQHFTLKQNPLKESDLDDFVKSYNPENRFDRSETYNEKTNPNGKWRKFSYDEIIARDKTSLDLRWIKETNEDEDVTIAELVDGIKDEAVNISSAAAELERLLSSVIPCPDTESTNESENNE